MNNSYTKYLSIMAKSILLLVLSLMFCPSLWAQLNKDQTNINFFGHVEYDFDKLSTGNNSYFSIGEQDIFITSKLNDRISFLGENVIRYDSKSSSYFIPSIERVQLKYDYFKNHSLIVGKMHTPVNYWNDVYHHGRLFFPTVERPLAFSYLVPIHTLGLRLQGQNLGDIRFGYDLVAGNGISSTDFSNSGVNASFLAAAHIKPFDNFRLGLSYYYDYLKNNFSGVHSGHSSSTHLSANSKYKKDIAFELYSLSVSYFSDSWEFLNESCVNKTKSDSLGAAFNLSSYTYAGYRVSPHVVPYVSYDFIDVSDKDLHVGHFSKNKLILGCRFDVNHQLNVKLHFAQIAPTHSLISNHSHNNGPNSYEFKIQLAYGF